MRKLLLISASVLALSAGGAMAGQEGGGGDGNGNGPPGPPHHVAPPIETLLGIAVSVNSSLSSDNTYNVGPDWTSSTDMSGSFNGSKGVANQNQNAGADSTLQNSLALAMVEGCSCAEGNKPPATKSQGNGAAFALSLNFGSIMGRGHGDGPPDDPKITTFVNAQIQNSYSGYNGVAQVNQNSGPNDTLQNSAAIAVVGPVQNAADQDSLAFAVSHNDGEVNGMSNSRSGLAASGDISGSFNGFQGIANVNQSVGANSLLQNSVALANVEVCGCSADDLAIAVAVSSNDGYVSGNYAASVSGSGSSSMNNSFNGTNGIMQVSQNAGANSLLQNSTAVGAITRTK